MRALIVILFWSCLAACATQGPPTVAVQTVCVPLKAYTPAQEKSLATAVQSLPADSPLVGAMEDFGAMRSADRSCISSSKGLSK